MLSYHLSRISFPLFLQLAFIWLFLFSSESLFADENFSLSSDGRIDAGSHTFSSYSQYVQSDYFRDRGMRCGTRKPESIADERMEKSVNDCTLAFTNIESEYWPSLTYTVKVWFHIIYQSNGTGNISDDVIEGQVEVLNQDFRAIAETMGSQGYDTKINFELAGITRTQNDGWFTDSYFDEYSYKNALAKDQNQFINVYTNDADGYLGYSYYPQDSAGSTLDGIVLSYSAVGGRNNSFYPFDQGRTLVHEMGHYFGLTHTFEGSTCTNSYSAGDLIVDTQAEITAHYGCSQSYTCGTADPIYNYMNYTDDSCMVQFTSEQANRAVCSMVNYRPNLFTIDLEQPDPETSRTSVPPFLTPLILR